MVVVDIELLSVEEEGTDGTTVVMITAKESDVSVNTDRIRGITPMPVSEVVEVEAVIFR